MGDSTKHGVKGKKKKKKKAAREATRGAGGRTDGLRRSLAPPVGFLPLPVRSAPALPPENSDAAPQHPNVTFGRLLECAGLFLTLLSTSSLSLHAAGCSLGVALHVREPESRWVALAKWQVGPVFRPLFICGYTSAHCETISGETLPPGKHSVVSVRNPTTALQDRPDPEEEKAGRHICGQN